MKPIIYIVYLLLLPVIATSQVFQDKNFELNDNQSGTTKTYEARDYIKLKKGFRFNSSEGEGHIINLLLN